MRDTRTQFQEAIRSMGLEPPLDIEPGRMYRFPGAGKCPGNTAGWCILYSDGKDGCFGDWSSGLSENWHADRGRHLSRQERAGLRQAVQEAKERADRKRVAVQRAAADRARMIWNAASPAGDNHPYLRRKAIRANGSRKYKGALVLPVIDFAGRLTSLQFIDAEGRKRLLTGGRKQGCYIPVAGEWTNVSRIIICEGWATGCTLAEDDPDALVLAAIDAGNLMTVAVTARCHRPEIELLIAGDDDRMTAGNPGASKARAAAIAANAKLALPPWPDNAPESLSDFNDLAVWSRRVRV